jgi:hypothetical protein
VLKEIALRGLFMNAQKSIRLDEHASALISTRGSGLCRLKLVKKRPGGKLDKLVVRCVSDGV